MIQAQLVDVIQKVLPMIIIFTVSVTSIRISYLKVKHEKLIFYKELLNLLFMLYILILFYIVSAQDSPSTALGSYNLIPFKEVMRYSIGSSLFYLNVVGNILIFIPFGLFVSYYIRTRRFSIILFLTFITSLAIEFSQRLVVGRVFDVDDIILNVAGGILGYIIYVILDSIGDHMPGFFKKDWFLNLITILIIATVLIYIYYINYGIMLVIR